MSYNLVCLLSTFLCLSAAYTATPLPTKENQVELNSDNLHLVEFTDLNEDTLQAFYQGKCPEVALKISEGMKMPFSHQVQGEFMSLEPVEKAPYILKILKNCFVRCIAENQFLFSADLLNWQPFENFFTGSIGLSINLNGSENEAFFNMEINERKTN